MKVAVVGKARYIIERKLSKYGMEKSKNPAVVICFGGDGTLLYGEELYPGIPKILIKHSSTCQKCEYHDIDLVLRFLKAKKFNLISETKVEACVKNNLKAHVKNKIIVGLNEINIHYRPARALRMQVTVNGNLVKPYVIGDGIVVATPYGSTAYFRSITGRTFKKGLGIAFNNPTKKIGPMILDEKSKIEVKILGGKGFVVSDRHEKPVNINEGDTILIKKHKKPALMIKLAAKPIKVKL